MRANVRTLECVVCGAAAVSAAAVLVAAGRPGEESHGARPASLAARQACARISIGVTTGSGSTHLLKGGVLVCE